MTRATKDDCQSAASAATNRLRGLGVLPKNARLEVSRRNGHTVVDVMLNEYESPNSPRLVRVHQVDMLFAGSSGEVQRQLRAITRAHFLADAATQMEVRIKEQQAERNEKQPCVKGTPGCSIVHTPAASEPCETW